MFESMKNINQLLEKTKLENKEEITGTDGEPSGLFLEAFSVIHKPISSLEGWNTMTNEDTVGYLIEEEESGKVLAYIPDILVLDAKVLQKIRNVECLFFDGTFWSNDEMIKLGISRKTAIDLGHIPISSPSGSAHELKDLKITHKIYTHVNNTNPILRADSNERKMLEEWGFEVASDGMEKPL